VLTDRQHGSTRGPRDADGFDAVICPRREVDDDPVDFEQRTLEVVERSGRCGFGAGLADEIRQSSGPDEVVGKDGDLR